VTTVRPQEGQRPHVVVLGGGPAGCGAAYQLHRTGRGVATVVEQQMHLGGNAGSFDLNGQRVDYGSHRLHHACDPNVLADIQSLLGEDLRDRVRHGRIRLRGKWLHFPLKPVDLLLRLDRAFAIGAFRDMVARMVVGKPPEGETFASVLRANLGPTICEHFYFPYARKIWGRDPEELSGIQARKRVTAGSFKALLKRLAKPPGEGRFYYPRLGYGQITEAYADAAQKLGANILMGWRVSRLHVPSGPGTPWRVDLQNDGRTQSLEADHVWSTIPVNLAIGMMNPPPPSHVAAAAGGTEYRSMVLVYLTLDIDQFTTTDAHYFPQADISVTRLSEPKNFFGLGEPRGRTTLCAEVPCSKADAVWNLSDADLARLVVDDMARAGLPIDRPPVDVHVRRLSHAYPIYTIGYERPLETLDTWVSGLPAFLSYGRQGLFAHDNTHHALFMSYCAVDCLHDGTFDRNRWNEYRKVFATHVVED
jgi:protoporphyrinogen oxidase